MLRFGHLIRPVQSAGSWIARAQQALRRYAQQAHEARQFRSFQRGQREACWCGGKLRTFEWHRNYGVCEECTAYVNRRPLLTEQLGRLYTFDMYWHRRQQSKGYPTIEQRPAHDRSDGRVQYWLDLISRFGPPSGLAIEVGCAHGVLLADLSARGYECVGVEPDERTADWVRNSLNLDIRAGFFPSVDLPACDMFLAFDVLEHSHDPLGFFRQMAHLLRANGVAILQTPIDRYDFRPPFGERFEAAFDDLEHLYLFTDQAIRRLAESVGLQVVNLQERLWLHHEICVLKKA